MKTPKDFDYDIWKDDSGHYYIRVKRTGETTRVSEEVVRELWRDLYRMDKYHKDTTITDEDGSQHTRILSLNSSGTMNPVPQSTENIPWLCSREDAYEEIETEMLEQAFLATLTEKQKRLYKLRFKMGLTVPECAKRVGANKRNVDKMIRLIREKAEKFF